jgi:hypothetical protein
MNLGAADYLMTRFAHAVPRAMKLLGDIETDLLRERLETIPIDRPVFIAGLARSGTTLLLNLLSKLPHVATHRYRDFPFLFVLVAWNSLQSGVARSSPPVERPHRDRIKITKDSPEAFEEPIWAHFFASVHDPGSLHRLTADDRLPEFDAFFLQHLRKVLLLRGGNRYLSKGNYNVTRIEYLADLLPDARFVVPVRHPASQIESLMRQHQLFCEYSARDRRVPRYLEAAGHFEFGPQRVPVNIDAEDARRIAEAWSANEEELGYALMWRSIYSHLLALQRDDAQLKERITFVRYEDLCRDAKGEIRRIAAFSDLRDGVEALTSNLPEVSPRRPGGFQLTREQQRKIWDVASETAVAFGYQPRGTM